MKPKSRVLGIDDGPFRFGDAEVPVVGVVVQAPSYIDGVLQTGGEVDGRDATERIGGMIRRSRYREGLAMVLVDGSAVGGFNVIDVDRLHGDAGVPVATVTRHKPDFFAMERALRRKFEDWEDRWEILRGHPLEEVPTRHRPVYVTQVGATLAEVREALALTTVRGALPEPLRIAHLVAASPLRGGSRGRARAPGAGDRIT